MHNKLIHSGETRVTTNCKQNEVNWFKEILAISKKEESLQHK